MGNEQSKKNPNVEIELNHSRINLIRVINEPKKRYMQAVFSVQKDQYSRWKADLLKFKANSDHLLIPFSHDFSSQQFCGNAGSVQANYESYPYLLLQEIENRRAKKKRFDQTELWLLLFCLLDAQKEMKMGNTSRIGDVRPQNIFFNEEGKMKVANLLSWPRETTNYQKFLENQPTYLAPQDIPLIQQSKIDNEQNTQSQIFSIGLTILSAANLTDYKTLYSTTSRKFNMEQFNQILNEWRVNDYYSDIFKATLCSLIEVDGQYRISENFIFPWLQNYRQDILARKDFVITDPPQLIINQVQIIRKIYENVASNYSVHNQHEFGLVSDMAKIGVPLEGSRRLVEQIRHPPIQVIPTTSISESIYKPIDQSTYMSKYLVQGAPITTVNPTFNNRTSVPVVENRGLVESLYTKDWSWRPKAFETNFEYTSSPQKGSEQVQTRDEQNTNEKKTEEQQGNQPQIHQNSNEQGESSPNKQ